MTTRDVLLKEIQQVLEPLLREILDFIGFVQVRGAGARVETAVVSEPSLSKDWLRPDERSVECVHGGAWHAWVVHSEPPSSILERTERCCIASLGRS